MRGLGKKDTKKEKEEKEAKKKTKTKKEDGEREQEKEDEITAGMGPKKESHGDLNFFIPDHVRVQCSRTAKVLGRCICMLGTSHI